MEVKIEQLEKLSHKAHFELPLAPIEKEIEDRLKEIAKNAKIQGFRPGKAPLKVVEKQRGAGLREEVISRALNQAFVSIVREKDLKIVGEPSFVPAPLTEEKPENLVFDVTFDIRPEINLPDLATLEVKKPVLEITDAELDKTLEVLRKRYPEYKAVDRASKDGDKMVIDFVGKLDGEAFQGGSAQGIELILGKGQFLPDFEKALYDRKAGDEAQFDVAFPENYGAENLAGKTAQFEATIKSVSEEVLPELNEDFAKRLGVLEGGLEKLRSDLKENLESEVKARVQGQLRTNIMRKLVESVTFDLPQSLVFREQQQLIQSAYQELMQRGLTEEDKPLPEDKFLPDAENKVRAGLLFEHIIGQEKITANPDLVKAKVEGLAKSYQQPEEVVKTIYSNPQQMQMFAVAVMEDQVIDWLASQMKTTEEPLPFSEILAEA